ncbi:aspartic peptidase domain-containing protein [Crassisporium funariophilum]|nr:aspartic peptidase domain-containing protein [Crassisporium funariophilum]
MARSSSTFISLFLVLASATTSTYGLKLPFQRRAPVKGATATSLPLTRNFTFGQTESESINNVQDIRYTTNITINGVSVHVVLDTGSTDLWVNPPGGVGDFNDTKIPIESFYGDGTYGVSGTIGVSPFTFGPYTVEKQAFMNIDKSTIKGLEENGIYGIFGLSFDLAKVSPINNKIKRLYGAGATWGQSPLRNIFQEHPDQPNFVAIDLSRTDDLEDTQGGSFDIGEYAAAYATVANKTKLPQSPKGGDRWTTILDGIFVGTEAVEVTSGIAGIPAGSAQALLDTGDPTAIFPTAIADAIYSRVPGAALYISDTVRVWVVPCNTTTIVELVFGGEKYPIHPLDLSTIIDPPIQVDGKVYTVCLASIEAVDSWGGDAYDMSLGDSFLRNVYSVYDFGDNLPDGTIGEPYMQLLSQIDPVKAVEQVTSIRGKTLASLPPLIDPATLVGLLGGTSSGTPATPPPVSTALPSLTDAPIPNPTSTDSADSAEGGVSKVKSAIATNLSAVGNYVVSFDESSLKGFGYVLIGLLGANFLIGVILIVLGIIACKRGSAVGSRKSVSLAGTGSQAQGQYVPLKNQESYYQTPAYGQI